MHYFRRFILGVACVVPAFALAADSHDCPLAADGAAPSGRHDHAGGVARRGEKGMGFSPGKTTHHFLLDGDGGSIQVTANDPADTASRDRIRTHLAHVRAMFAEGDFSIPMFVHDALPPGVSTMKRRAAAIRYSFEEIAGGARVRLATGDADARDAIHDFLRFQIQEHETGDPVAKP